jgi:AcrR family transcriptional regulator
MTAQSTMRAPRGPYSSPRQVARQRRILEVTRQEIGAVGYDAITMQLLAEAADVSTKTLYNLYGSKDELLLAAVADLLGNLELQASVVSAEPGIPSLLAFTDVVAEQVRATPRYAEVMAKALFQAPAEHNLVGLLLGNMVRVSQRALESERDCGGVAVDLDIDAVSQLLTAHQWGLILTWSKGQISLEEFPGLARQSLIVSLLPLCTASRRRALEPFLDLAASD